LHRKTGAISGSCAAQPSRPVDGGRRGTQQEDRSDCHADHPIRPCRAFAYRRRRRQRQRAGCQDLLRAGRPQPLL